MVDLSTPLPEHSRPSSSKSPNENVTNDESRQVNEAFLHYLPVKQHYNNRYSRKSNINYASSIISIADRTPSSLLELKQQRLIAAADRKKRIIARIVSIVGLLIILLCAAIVTLTLKMAPKIDELVRTKAGAHHLVHLVSRVTTSATTTTTTTSDVTTSRKILSSITTNRRDNLTPTNALLERVFVRTRRK